MLTTNLLVIGAFSWDGLALKSQLQRDYLADYAKTLISVAAASVGPLLVTWDYAALEDYVNRLVREPDVVAVTVVDEDDRELSSVRRSADSGVPDASAATVQFASYKISQSVMLGGKSRGRITVELSAATVLTHFDDATGRTWFVAAIVLAGCTAIAVFVGLGLARPVTELDDILEQLATGKGEISQLHGSAEEINRVTTTAQKLFKELRERLQRVAAREERFRSLVEHSPDCVLLTGLDFRLEHINAVGVRMFALDKPEQVIGQSLMELFPPVSRDWLFRGMQGAKAGQVMENTIVAYDQKGDEKWFEVTLAPVRSEQGAVSAIMGNLRDVTAQRAQAAALEHLSFHDALTGFPNRALFLEQLQSVLADNSNANAIWGIFIMDLDRFKEVNDTVGHHVGDQLLQQVAYRLQNAMNASQVIARLGGDEFALLIRLRSEDQAAFYAQEIARALENPVSLTDLDIPISTSVGISLFPQHGRDGATLIQRADVAMYHAKRHRLGFEVYSPEFDPNSLRRLTLVGELRHAIDNDELVLQFQPKMCAQDGATCGVEALVRWHHPSHGLMGPAEFIPLAEETGLIRPLTRWVLDQALYTWTQWNKAGLDLTMAVNLSARNLMDPKLCDMIQTQLGRWNVPPERLELEITESDIMSDPNRARRMLARLDEMGIMLSIDDFGTGHSSLAYLKQLPVDMIKIDKSFVLTMETNDNDRMIVVATIDLAHKLGLKVVAEGVETHQTLNMLKDFGCDLIQGFYVSRPIDNRGLIDFIQANRRTRHSAV